MKMPFSKYRGVDIEELPTHYLEWLAGIDLRERLVGAVERELKYRRYNSLPTKAALAIRLLLVPADVGREIVDAGYKAAARWHHPDFGDNDETMRRLNAQAGSLRAQLGALEAR